jgi:hypothetical protein
MIDLRTHLQELADAATREGATPGPAHAIRRGRQRRRRIVGGVASLLVVALVAGAAGTSRLLSDRPARPVTPATTPPTAPKLQIRTDKLRPGSPEERAFATLATELRRCPGGASIPADLTGYVWSKQYRRFWMVAAKQPPAPETRYCWTSGLFNAEGTGAMWGARRVGSLARPMTSAGGIYSGFAQIEGRVTKRASRLRLRFRDGRAPMDLMVIDAGDRYPVNFYVGFFPQPPTSPRQGGWAAQTLTAFDAAGRTVATCRVGPPGDGTPKCPGN